MDTAVEEDLLVIPAGIVDLASFRRWTLSREFPERGRIDYIAGRIEVDMSPASLWRHSSLKTVLGIAIGNLVEARELGSVFIDQTRVASPIADLSCEPDVLFVSWESLRAGRVICRPSARPRDELDKMEFEGGPEIVVEVVSPCSRQKDMHRLPGAYFAAGVVEYWLADATHTTRRPSLTIFRRGDSAFEPAGADADGYQRSAVLETSVRLASQPGPVPETVRYSLERR